MAMKLDKIKVAVKTEKLRVTERLDPERSKRTYARRNKGKLYNIEIVGLSRKIQHKADENGNPIYGTFGRYKGPNSETFNRSAFIPENQAVLYLGTTNKMHAKVLFDDKIWLIPRSDLSVDPIY